MSTTSTVFVRMRTAEGGLLRLIGLTGRRGFDVCNLHMTPYDNGAYCDIVMQVRSNRSIDHWERQIGKLYDVVAVTALPLLGHQQAAVSSSADCSEVEKRRMP